MSSIEALERQMIAALASAPAEKLPEEDRRFLAYRAAKPRIQHPALHALWLRMATLGLSQQRLCELSGLGRNALWRWRMKTNPLADVEAALNAVGLTLRAVPIDAEEAHHDR